MTPSPCRWRDADVGPVSRQARCQRLCDVLPLASPTQATRLRRSLDAESAATLVHAFVTSHVDYCNAVLAGASKSTTDKLQRVLNAAARGSTTADSAISCTTSCTGWTFLSGCSTICAQRSIDVCSTKHHGTRRTAAYTPQTLLVASICGPPAAISCSYRDTGVPCSVVGLFL